MAGPAENIAGSDRRIVVGRVSGVYGVMGWIKVFSYTRPKENILHYSPWLLKTAQGWEEYRLEMGRAHGKGLIALLEGIEDRDRARHLMESDIAVFRSQLPALPEGEYYWCDLMGLIVVNLDGRELGRVLEIRETGGNDVLVVEGDGRHLVPLLMEHTIREVDLGNGRILVDWHAE